jgi:hypothetical protein
MIPHSVNEKSEMLSYTPAMPCAELIRMREEATALKEKMKEQRSKARAMSTDPRLGRISGKSEMIPFLQRKLQRLAEKIEQHMSEHHCQE